MQIASVLKKLAVALAAPATIAGAATPAATAAPYAATIIHSFGLNASAGYYPDGGGSLALGRDGNFYGATLSGGANGSGSLFRMTPDGRTTTLYSFSPEPTNVDGSPGPNADGGYPLNGLVEGPDGSWYGVAAYGGTGDSGTVFKLSAQGTFTILHSFTPSSSTAPNTDGQQPNASLLLTGDGSLYGTTASGGAHNEGTAFRIAGDGSFSTLYQFGGVLLSGSLAPAVPLSGMVLGDDGALYGATNIGGDANIGSLYRLTRSGRLTVLHSFDPLLSHGARGEAPLVKGSDGNFYGTTAWTNDTPQGKNMAPTIFKITPDGQYTELHDGNDQGPYIGEDLDIDAISGGNGLIQGSDGNFYGVTAGGGEFGWGVVYRITPSGDFTTLYNFGITATDGVDPSSGLTFGKDGNLYGTTIYGGTRNKGAAFMLPLPAPTGWDTGPAITVTSTMKPLRISISKGQTATMTWSSVNAAQCHLWDGVEGHSPQTIATSGSMSIAPTKPQEYIYHLDCDNTGRATDIIGGEVTVVR